MVNKEDYNETDYIVKSQRYGKRKCKIQSLALIKYSNSSWKWEFSLEIPKDDFEISALFGPELQLGPYWALQK